MKNLHFLGAQDFQILSAGSKQTTPLEEGCICRFGRVLSRGREPPNVCVRNIRLKGNLFYLLEQHHELQDHRYLEGSPEVSSPIQVLEGFTSFLLINYSFGNHGTNVWCYILDLFTMQPPALPKQC
jgi:hypothetical protein